jgi:hypothetical protein
MKAKIDVDGVITISPESEVEAFALRMWGEKYMTGHPSTGIQVDSSKINISCYFTPKAVAPSNKAAEPQAITADCNEWRRDNLLQTSRTCAKCGIGPCLNRVKFT